MAASDAHPVLRASQLAKLQLLMRAVSNSDGFYPNKYRAADCDPLAVTTPAEFAKLPLTTKAELAADQVNHPPYGTNLLQPQSEYCRVHQTSGTTTGRPLRWLDTAASWNWLLDCWWDGFHDCMGLTPDDRVFFPFSFGPFLGFWAAFEAVTRAGHFAISGGGMPTTTRLRTILEHRATVVCCTPTYALHLAEVAEAEKIDLHQSGVRAVVVAGEPGGSIPTTRERIAGVWGARVYDHYGLTEVGPVAFETTERPNEMRLLESKFLVEVLDPVSGLPSESGELVLTNLGRLGSPLIRYRTGDLVTLSPDRDGAGNCYLVGGILSRADDMIHLRGNNLYPSAIEAVIRRFREVVEFRIVVDQSEALADLKIEIEPADNSNGVNLAESVSRAIRDDLLFRAEVVAVAPGTLPRFELKSQRVVRLKKSV